MDFYYRFVFPFNHLRVLTDLRVRIPSWTKIISTLSYLATLILYLRKYHHHHKLMERFSFSKTQVILSRQNLRKAVERFQTR
jgi:hypothetical protein